MFTATKKYKKEKFKKKKQKLRERNLISGAHMCVHFFPATPTPPVWGERWKCPAPGGPIENDKHNILQLHLASYISSVFHRLVGTTTISLAPDPDPDPDLDCVFFVEFSARAVRQTTAGFLL